MIQKAWRAHYYYTNLQKVLAKQAAEKNERKRREKEEKRLQMKEEARQKIYDMFMNIYARRIQRTYKKWITKEKRKRLGKEKRRVQREQAVKDREEREKARLQEIEDKKIFNKIKKIGKSMIESSMKEDESKRNRPGKLEGLIKAMNKMTSSRKKGLEDEEEEGVETSSWKDKLSIENLLAPTVDEEYEEEKKMDAEAEPEAAYSIVFRQTLSIVQEGFIQLSLTFGEGEAHSFGEVQKYNQKLGKKFFEMIDYDLSGRQHKMIYLWVVRGRGKDVFTDIQFKTKPPALSRQVMEGRRITLKASGYQLVYHNMIQSFEVHGYSAMKMNRSGAAIDDIISVSTTSEKTSARARNYKPLCVMGDFGYFGAEIWIHTKAPPTSLKNPAVETLSTFDFFDDRMETIVESYALDVDDVMAQFEVFRSLDYENNGTTIYVDDFWELMVFHLFNFVISFF